MKCIIRLFFISLIASSLVVFYSCHEGLEGLMESEVTTKFEVEGMTCSSCENALRGALENKSKYPLIHKVEADSQTNTCTIVHDKKMTTELLKKAINSTKKFRVKAIVN